MHKVSRKQWRARARQWEGEAAVLRRHLEAAEAQLAAAEVETGITEGLLVSLQDAEGALRSEITRKGVQFRNVLNALGNAAEPTADKVAKAKRICRDELV